MTKIYQIVFYFAIVVLTFTYQTFTSCPTGIAPIDLYSDSITISTSSTASIHLVSGQDVNCFNYTLPSPFLQQPNVAIGNFQIYKAINHFQAERTPDLFFSIKPVWSYQFVQLPFQVRTQWKYSQWIKLIVNFLIESRTDIQAGYYQRDTGLVGTCGTLKSQSIYLPFTRNWNVSPYKELTIRVFLNGFEISSQGDSPYQLKIASVSYNNTGINAKISVNSTTIVNSVYVSYIVFAKNNFGLRNINGFIEKFYSQSSFSQPIVENGFNSFKYFLYGISGFKFASTNQIFLDIFVETNLLINFNFSNQNYDYIGFQYIMFDYSPCSRCVNYPFLYNTQCVRNCPRDTLMIGNTCFGCPTNSYSHHGRCICKQGYVNISGDCTTCPLGQIFTGGMCTGCGKNALWVGNLCQCNVGFYNISGVCQSCPKGAHWNGYSCMGCGINSYYFAGSCVCQPGYYNISGICNRCPSGTIFNGTSCVLPCKPGEVWSGSRCLSFCKRIEHSFWNGIQCICGDGYYNISGRCSHCDDGQVWNGSQCAYMGQQNIYVAFNKDQKRTKAR